MSESRRGRRKWIWGTVGTAVLVVAICVAVVLGPTFVTLSKHGFFDSADDRKYTGATTDDLKAIRTAIMFYHDSEGVFPDSSHWMDQIQRRIQTSDMSKEESAKKLVDPAFAGQPGKYGFAINDAVAGKYKGDIKDPKTPLVFESSDPSRNAHGDPTVLAPKPAHRGGNWAIAVDGSLIKLGS